MTISGAGGGNKCQENGEVAVGGKQSWGEKGQEILKHAMVLKNNK